MNNIRQLNPELVERGTVIKEEKEAFDGNEMSVLHLGPNSKVKRHHHPEPELYIFADGKTKMYGSWESHELVNDTEEEQDVISIKGYNIRVAKITV